MTNLRVDSIKNSLDEVALSSVKNVCQVSSSLITQLLGNQIVNMVAENKEKKSEVEIGSDRVGLNIRFSVK